MWPLSMDWKKLNFGVEVEFVKGNLEDIQLLPDWTLALDEEQIDDNGDKSGAELQSPPMKWDERTQIAEMLDRIKSKGAIANWNCGLHVHVGLEAWGSDILLPMIDAICKYQWAFQEVFQTSKHRLIFCPPLTKDMVHSFKKSLSKTALRIVGRPQSHRCGINLGAWFDKGTVEFRYANGTLAFAEVEKVVELCLRFVAAVGNGESPPVDAKGFLRDLSVSPDGFPPPQTAPRWYDERIWLENMLLPLVEPYVQAIHPKAEILEILPRLDGIHVTGENVDGDPFNLTMRLAHGNWEMVNL